MKKIIYLIFSVCIASCSPKYTASFQNYNSTYNGSYTTVATPTRETDTSTVKSELRTKEPVASVVDRPTEFKDVPMSASYYLKKFSEPSGKALSQQGSKQNNDIPVEGAGEKPKKGNPKKNGFAIAGFAISLSYVALYTLLLFPVSIVFCIIGLKSEKRKLAKAGLIISFIFAVFFVLYTIATLGFTV